MCRVGSLPGKEMMRKRRCCPSLLKCAPHCLCCVLPLQNRTAFRSFMESSMSSIGNQGLFHDEEAGLAAPAAAGSPLGTKAATPVAAAAGGKKGSGQAVAGNDPSGPSGLVKLLGSHLSSGSSGSHDTAPAGGTPIAAGAPAAAPSDALIPSAALGPGTPSAPPSRLADILEGSLWTRRLAPSSEDLVNALVARIFYGVRDHFVLSTELKVRPRHLGCNPPCWLMSSAPSLSMLVLALQCSPCMRPHAFGPAVCGCPVMRWSGHLSISVLLSLGVVRGWDAVCSSTASS